MTKLMVKSSLFELWASSGQGLGGKSWGEGGWIGLRRGPSWTNLGVKVVGLGSGGALLGPLFVNL